MTDKLQTWQPRLASKARLRWDKVEKQYMMVFPEAALVLNQTAAEVLKLCDGDRSVPDIIDTLLEKFAEAKREQIEEHVVELLTRIHERGLLETGLLETGLETESES